MSIQSVPRQIPSNLDLETNRSVSNQLGEWVYGAVEAGDIQKISSGTSATVEDNTRTVQLDFATLKAAFTLKLAANPVDGDVITILVGTTIAAETNAITALTVSANTGQTLYGSAPTNPVTGGTVLQYQYLGSEKKWFRIK